MERRLLYKSAIVFSAFVAVFVVTSQVYGLVGSFSVTEPGFEDEESLLPDLSEFIDPYANWQRPDGPLRVGIQVGHWFAADAPDEQEGLRDNTGAQAAGVTEWETNLEIAEETKKLLEAEGITVNLLPTTIPPKYWADAFISIHADGNSDTDVRGYKIAAPRRDRSGKAQQLATMIEESYGKVTGMNIDPNITRNMRGYYAFNSRRYQHSIHPMTPGAIVETGFITNAADRKIIVSNPKRSAQAIANAIIAFLKETVQR